MATASVKPPRLTEVARSFASLLGSTTAVILCFLSLLIFKTIAVSGAASGRALTFLRCGEFVRVAPKAATFLGLALALFSAVPATTQILPWFENWLFRDSLFMVGLMLVINGAPQTLARASVVRMSGEEISDPMEAWFASRLSHVSDAVWPGVLLIMSLLILPAAIALLFPNAFGAKTVVLYAVALWVTWKSATDFEHADSHYHFFRGQRAGGPRGRFLFGCLDFYVTYIFTIASARVPHWYEVQHVVIHHAEDNGPDDTQSTLPYDRASFVDFARCANRFAMSGLFSIDVFEYLARKGRTKAIRRLAVGELMFFGMIGALVLVDWRVAIVILAVRYARGIISSMGFFQEHGIIDMLDPENIYRNSLHYLSPDNTHGSRGEDFHIAHHLKPGRHWAEYEAQVAAEAQRYANEGSVGYFEGPGQLETYYRLLWRRDFTALAQHFVFFGKPNISIDESAVLLRARTLPLGVTEPSPKRMDLLLGRVASHLLG